MDAAKPKRSRRRALLVVAGLAVLSGAIFSIRACSTSESNDGNRAPLASFRSPAVEPAQTAPQPPALTAPVVAAAPASTPRLRALTLSLDGGTVRLRGAATYAGRVKAPPLSHAEDRLEISGYDAAGQRVYVASLDHPRGFHVDQLQADGELQRQPAEMTDVSLMLRIPQELPLARLDVFDTDAQGSRLIGSVQLDPE